jgi:hypothetical protein
VVQFPEFGAVDTTFLQAHLNAAVLEVDANIWGAKVDQGIMYLAAHKIALSPFGNNAKLVAKDGTTTYEKHYSRLKLQVSSGFRVT